MTSNTVHPLMVPRYQLIADYPSNRLSVGEILESTTNNMIQKRTFKICAHGSFGWMLPEELDKWPHLFRKLEWWEHRKPEEMPEYVKQTGMVDSFNIPVPDWYLKVKHHFRAGNGEWRDDSYNIFCAYPDERTIGIAMSYSGFEPATLEEYTEYINQNKIVK